MYDPSFVLDEASGFEADHVDEKVMCGANIRVREHGYGIKRVERHGPTMGPTTRHAPAEQS